MSDNFKSKTEYSTKTNELCLTIIELINKICDCFTCNILDNIAKLPLNSGIIA